MTLKSSVLVFIASWFVATAAFAGSVGFRTLAVPDGDGPAIEVGVWYPTEAPPHPTSVGLFTQDLAPDAPVKGDRLPLIVLSHGHGGDFAGHSDTALALAEAGFVAAALTHTGDNARDRSRSVDMANRPRQLHVLIDFMVVHWPVDPARIGAFGFSSGGFTVLAAAGGNPDLRLVSPHCASHPAFYDCQLMAKAGPAGDVIASTVLVHDRRIRAIVVAAPALGFAFADPGLRDVAMPVQLWRAADDRILPSPYYVEPVAAALPLAPEIHLVAQAGHYDFLAPCPDRLAQLVPEICRSAPGFDRTEFHRDFNAAVVGFFRRTLAAS